MFFTDDVLHARNGRFAVIWLAATKKDSLKKRQYENENVEETCSELQRHFKPSFRGGRLTIAGFSLRLSSQLTYGVTVVYHLQVSSLYKEAHLTFQSLMRYRPRLIQSIDLDARKQNPSDKQQSVPETYLYNDPTFGEHGGLPCDEFPPLPMQEAREESMLQNVVTDVSTITLPEEIPTRATDLVFGGEHGMGIDDPDPDFLDFLAFGKDVDDGFMEIPAQTANMETPLAATLPPDPKDIPKTPTKERKKKTADDESVLAVPIIEVTEPAPTPPPPEPREQDRHTSEDAQSPSFRTSSEEQSDLVLEPVAEDSREPKKRKKKFLDVRTELTSEEIKDQLRARHRTIDDYRDEGLLDEPFGLASAKELFTNPGTLRTSSFSYKLDKYMHSRMKDVPHDLSIPTQMFREQLRDIEKNLRDRKPRRPFSAYKAAAKAAKKQPEDSFNEMPDGPQFDDTLKALEQPEDIYTEMIDGPKFEDTLPDLTMESVELQRNISGRSALDVTYGRHSDVEHLNASEDVEPTILMPQSILKEADYSAREEKSVRKPKLSSHTRLYEKSLKGVSKEGIMFSSLAPPGVTSRAKAAQLFSDILLLAKGEKVVLVQKKPYTDFLICPVKKGVF